MRSGWFIFPMSLICVSAIVVTGLLVWTTKGYISASDDMDAKFELLNTKHEFCTRQFEDIDKEANEAKANRKKCVQLAVSTREKSKKIEQLTKCEQQYLDGLWEQFRNLVKDCFGRFEESDESLASWIRKNQSMISSSRNSFQEHTQQTQGRLSGIILASALFLIGLAGTVFTLATKYHGSQRYFEQFESVSNNWIEEQERLVQRISANIDSYKFYFFASTDLSSMNEVSFQLGKVGESPEHLYMQLEMLSAISSKKLPRGLTALGVYWRNKRAALIYEDYKDDSYWQYHDYERLVADFNEIFLKKRSAIKDCEQQMYRTSCDAVETYRKLERDGQLDEHKCNEKLIALCNLAIAEVALLVDAKQSDASLKDVRSRKLYATIIDLIDYEEGKMLRKLTKQEAVGIQGLIASGYRKLEKISEATRWFGKLEKELDENNRSNKNNKSYKHMELWLYYNIACFSSRYLNKFDHAWTVLKKSHSVLSEIIDNSDDDQKYFCAREYLVTLVADLENEGDLVRLLNLEMMYWLEDLEVNAVRLGYDNTSSPPTDDTIL